jgi:biotin transport system substrate-specific component
MKGPDMNRTHTLYHNHEVINNKALNAIIGVSFFILATAFGAYVRIPVPGTPVPITLQTFFVVLAGAVLGKKLGSASQLGYVMLGILGLPAFQGCAFGLAHLAGPTGGYLAGFAAAGFVVGKMLEGAKPSMGRIAASFIAGNIAIYSLGVLWLVIGYKYQIMNALFVGVAPFVPAEMGKVAAAVLVYSKIAPRSKEIFSA